MSLRPFVLILITMAFLISCESEQSKFDKAASGDSSEADRILKNALDNPADLSGKEPGGWQDTLDKAQDTLDKALQRQEQAQAEIYHPEFTQNSELKIKRGLTTKNIILIFGKPDATVTQPMGSATSSPWTALIYIYHMKKIDTDVWDLSKDNKFFFNIDSGRLTYWQIDFVN
jgi:hypothetical protein